jgi:hypothetical protein
VNVFEAIFGLWYDYMLVFLPLDLIAKSKTLQGVLQAVWKPKKTL